MRTDFRLTLPKRLASLLNCDLAVLHFFGWNYSYVGHGTGWQCLKGGVNLSAIAALSTLRWRFFRFTGAFYDASTLIWRFPRFYCALFALFAL
jgi:hypothetical protein